MDIRKTIQKYRRVLKIARKPTKDEFLASSKISAIGMLITGVVGFLIFVIFILFGI